MREINGRGFEYEVVGYCPNTHKPVVAPRAWSHPDNPRPHYSTCSCCAKKK